MKRRVARIGIIAAVFGLVFGLSDLARADVTGHHVCDNRSVALCISTVNTAGGSPQSKTQQPLTSEKISIHGVAVCTHNGSPSEFVQSKAHGDGSNCPFTHDEWNDQFDGREIVNISNLNNDLGARCILGNNFSSGLQMGACSASGHLWVVVPTGSAINYVNVVRRDNTGGLIDGTLTDIGQGDPLFVSECNGNCFFSDFGP